MRKLLLLALTVVGASAWASAQDQREFEVFGGYSFEHIAICGNTAGGCGLESGDIANLPKNFNGWNAAFTGYASKGLGITADFSGHYVTDNANGVSGVSLARYDYHFGPTFPLHLGSEKTTGFVHLLFGGYHQSVFNTNGFSMALGGGVDFRVSERWAIRAAQVDYVGASVSRSSVGNGIGFTNGFRYSGGAVFRWSWMK